MNFMGEEQEHRSAEENSGGGRPALLRRGVRATGTEKIMSLAEVAKATFYRHFESKDALVLAYLEYRDRALWDYLSQSHSPKGSA